MISVNQPPIAFKALMVKNCTEEKAKGIIQDTLSDLEKKLQKQGCGMSSDDTFVKFEETDKGLKVTFNKQSFIKKCPKNYITPEYLRDVDMIISKMENIFKRIFRREGHSAYKVD